MKILLIDNYDSFTYNLVHYLEGANTEVTVWRNDAISFQELSTFDAFVISPGPGLPAEAGLLTKFIEHAVAIKKPILGVCLGFQALVEHFGGTLFNQSRVRHGVSDSCRITASSRLFQGMPEIFPVGLYHSWAAEPHHFPESLQITALSERDVIMAFEHQTLPIFGVQFHPESILTENGRQLIRNFCRI